MTSPNITIQNLDPKILSALLNPDSVPQEYWTSNKAAEAAVPLEKLTTPEDSTGPLDQSILSQLQGDSLQVEPTEAANEETGTVEAANEQLTNPNVQTYRDWTKEQRDKLSKGEIKGAFAGPDQSYPIASSGDVKDAWGLAGHAAKPDDVRRKIISIAKKYGWTSGLPKSARQWAKDRNITLSATSAAERLTQIPNLKDLLTQLSEEGGLENMTLAEILAQVTMSSSDILGSWAEVKDGDITSIQADFQFTKYTTASKFLESALATCRYKKHNPLKASIEISTEGFTCQVQLGTTESNVLTRMDIILANYLNFTFHSLTYEEENSRDLSYYDYYSAGNEGLQSKETLSAATAQLESMVELPQEQSGGFEAYTTTTESGEERMMLKVPVAILGEWKHPVYKKVSFAQKDYDQINLNYSNKVLGFEPPLFLGHPNDTHTIEGAPAEGFLTELVQEDSVLFGLYEIVDEETFADARKGKYRYASAEIIRDYKTKEDGSNVGTVLFGHALTNRPFLPNLPRVTSLSDGSKPTVLADHTGSSDHFAFLMRISAEETMKTNSNSDSNSNSNTDQTKAALTFPPAIPECLSQPTSSTEVETSNNVSAGASRDIETLRQAFAQSLNNLEQKLTQQFSEKIDAITARAEAAEKQLRQEQVDKKLTKLEALCLPAEVKEEYAQKIKDAELGDHEDTILATLEKMSEQSQVVLTTQQGQSTSTEGENDQRYSDNSSDEIENPYAKTISRNREAVSHRNGHAAV
jgi:pterin-4a-carbinolamine dehydratase/ATP-dependent protease HslVU (ClpYQ) peptidase subunit